MPVPVWRQYMVSNHFSDLWQVFSEVALVYSSKSGRCFLVISIAQAYIFSERISSGTSCISSVHESVIFITALSNKWSVGIFATGHALLTALLNLPLMRGFCRRIPGVDVTNYLFEFAVFQFCHWSPPLLTRHVFFSLWFHCRPAMGQTPFAAAHFRYRRCSFHHIWLLSL